MRLRRVAILITGTALAHRSDRFALAAFESRLPIRRRGEAQSTRFLLYKKFRLCMCHCTSVLVSCLLYDKI